VQAEVSGQLGVTLFMTAVWFIIDLSRVLARGLQAFIACSNFLLEVRKHKQPVANTLLSRFLLPLSVQTQHRSIVLVWCYFV
jgi:hypothetical protein